MIDGWVQTCFFVDDTFKAKIMDRVRLVLATRWLQSLIYSLSRDVARPEELVAGLLSVVEAPGHRLHKKSQNERQY